MAGKSEKKEKKNDRDTRRFYSEKNTRTKVREKSQKNVIVRSFPGAKLDCMSHYAILTVKSNPNRITIHCGTNSLKKDESPEVISEKTIKQAKSIKSISN